MVNIQTHTYSHECGFTQKQTKDKKKDESNLIKLGETIGFLGNTSSSTDFKSKETKTHQCVYGLENRKEPR